MLRESDKVISEEIAAPIRATKQRATSRKKGRE